MKNDQLKYCNCVGCGKELLGLSCLEFWKSLPAKQQAKTPIVAGRLGGRPYCQGCLRIRTYVARPEGVRS